MNVAGILLIIIAALAGLGFIALIVVFVAMEIDSRKLWESRNELEKENRELSKKM